MGRKRGSDAPTSREQDITVEAMKGRLYQRPEYGNALALDLRGKVWGNRGRLTLRNPADPGWPREGRTTTRMAVAEKWVEDHYHPMIAAQLHIAAEVPDEAGLTGAEAVERYVREKSDSLGADHDTVRNRTSALRKHFVPLFGDRELATITKREIREHLDGLKVRKQVDGRWRTVRAEIGTKRALRTSYLALWRHVLPDVDCPWEGIYLNTDAEKRALREQIKDGEFENLTQPESGALTPSQVLKLLTAALWYDFNRIANRKNTSSWAVANTAFAIALQIATGMRKAELVLLRWWMIDFENGYIRSPAVKGRTLTRKGRLLRAIPLQRQLLPWFELLKELTRPGGDEPRRHAFVWETNAKNQTPPTRKALGTRFRNALIIAGLKQPKKESHGFRATYASWGAAEHQLVSREQLKAFLGHANAWLGATDDYVEVMAAMITPEHRTFIKHLPSPAEVRAALTDFKPMALPPKRKPRSKSARTSRKRSELSRTDE